MIPPERQENTGLKAKIINMGKELTRLRASNAEWERIAKLSAAQLTNEILRLRASHAELLAACQDHLQWLALNTPFAISEAQAVMADSMDRQRERLRNIIAHAQEAPP